MNFGQAIQGPVAGSNYYGVRESISITHSKHSIRFGADASLEKFIQDTSLNNYSTWSFDGKKTNIIEKQVDYVLGSGNHARAFLSRTKQNTLVELPLAWYSEKGGSWAMNPAYDRPDHPGFRRAITDQCMFCHNGIPAINSREAGEQATFPAELPLGIDCQRCHGPGNAHVLKAEYPC